MRINIYLTPLEQKELSRLKYQYHLSFSTICNIIVKHTTCTAKIIEVQEYRYKEIGNKTSIKPKYEQNAYWLDSSYNKSKLYSNCVKRYLRHDYKDLDEKTKTKLLNKILNELKETYDAHWDGNEWNRKLPRYLKEHKEYYKKVLETC